MNNIISYLILINLDDCNEYFLSTLANLQDGMNNTDPSVFGAWGDITLEDYMDESAEESD